MKALWTSFLASPEVKFCRDHALLLTVCGAVVALACIFVAAAQ